MNLAEIRKKAVEARKLDEPEMLQPPAEPVVARIKDFDDDNAVLDAAASEYSGDAGFDDDGFGEGVSEDFDQFDLGDTPDDRFVPEADDLVDTPVGMDEKPDEIPTEPVSLHREEPVPVAAVVEVAPVRSEPVRHPAYDPLATLLAGRQAASAGEGVPTDEGQTYLSDEVEEYLCFKVAHEEYALSIMDIKEIIKPREVTEVPRMPKFVSGVISLRGVIIPIMDMRLRLSLPVGELTGRERILVLRTSDGYCGVLVDEVIQVVKITSGAIEGPPTILDGIDKEFVKGLGRFDNRMLILLNLDSILDLEIR
jgi:purine-binding chemotaxis protein CheW